MGKKQKINFNSIANFGYKLFTLLLMASKLTMQGTRAGQVFFIAGRSEMSIINLSASKSHFVSLYHEKT